MGEGWGAAVMLAAAALVLALLALAVCMLVAWRAGALVQDALRHLLDAAEHRRKAEGDLKHARALLAETRKLLEGGNR